METRLKKKKFGGVLLYSFILFFIYFIIFSPSTGKEVIVKPLKSIDLEDEIGSSDNFSNKDQTSWFEVGDRFGYLGKDASLVYKDTIDYRIALSESGFINYSSIQEGEQGFVYRNVRGEVKSSFHQSGYPVLSHDGRKIAVVKPDGTGLIQISADGEEEWNASFASIITAISIQNEYTLIGLLNGSLRLYSSDGKCIYAVTLRVTTPESIYGASLSQNEKMLAAVYGIEPQRIVLIKKGSSNMEKPVSIEIPTDLRRQVFVRFSENGRFLFTEGKNSVMIMDTDSMKLRSIPVSGSFESLSESSGSRYITVLTQSGNDFIKSSSLYIFTPPDITFLEERFSGSSVSAKTFGDLLVIGQDTNLIIFRIEEG
jgi:hypothetical protein